MSVYSFSVGFGAYGIAYASVILGWIVPSWEIVTVDLIVGLSLLLIHEIRRLP